MKIWILIACISKIFILLKLNKIQNQKQHHIHVIYVCILHRKNQLMKNILIYVKRLSMVVQMYMNKKCHKKVMIYLNLQTFRIWIETHIRYTLISNVYSKIYHHNKLVIHHLNLHLIHKNHNQRRKLNISKNISLSHIVFILNLTNNKIANSLYIKD